MWNQQPGLFSAGGITVSDTSSAVGAPNNVRCAGQWALRGTFSSVTSSTTNDAGGQTLGYSTIAMVQRIS